VRRTVSEVAVQKVFVVDGTLYPAKFQALR
jgi:hypothetical protein